MARSSKSPATVSRVAIVADWLTTPGGAERVIVALHKAYPKAPIFTSVYDASKFPDLKNADVRTMWLQHLPRKLRNYHQLFPVFRAFAFKRLDVSDYDIVITSASAEAKAIRVAPGAVQLCYCHTPIRYYWSHYNEYRRTPGFGILDPLIKTLIPPFVRWMRKFDLESVSGVTAFMANSSVVKKRIKKYYRRDATTIFPPIDTTRMRPKKLPVKEDFYLVVGRQIPYKRTDLAIKAANKLGKRLVIIGTGSEHEKLMAMAGPTVEFKTGVNDQEIVQYFQQAKALLWPQVEDFGITAVEAMAAGTPVIAYQKAGALDYMIDGKTGLFFAEQTVDSLVHALHRFEKTTFDSALLMRHAEKFSEERFIQEIHKFVIAHTPRPN